MASPPLAAKTVQPGLRPVGNAPLSVAGATTSPKGKHVTGFSVICGSLQHGYHRLTEFSGRYRSPTNSVRWCDSSSFATPEGEVCCMLILELTQVAHCIAASKVPPKGETTHYDLCVVDAPSNHVRCAPLRGKGGASAPKGVHFRRPPGRLYGFPRPLYLVFYKLSPTGAIHSK